MVQVYVREGDDFEFVLKLFKRKVEKEGIINEYRTRQYYEKPSVKKRREKQDAIKRAKKKNRREI